MEDDVAFDDVLLQVNLEPEPEPTQTPPTASQESGDGTYYDDPNHRAQFTQETEQRQQQQAGGEWYFHWTPKNDCVKSFKQHIRRMNLWKQIESSKDLIRVDAEYEKAKLSGRGDYLRLWSNYAIGKTMKMSREKVAKLLAKYLHMKRNDKLPNPKNEKTVSVRSVINYRCKNSHRWTSVMGNIFVIVDPLVINSQDRWSGKVTKYGYIQVDLGVQYCGKCARSGKGRNPGWTYFKISEIQRVALWLHRKCYGTPEVFRESWKVSDVYKIHDYPIDLPPSEATGAIISCLVGRIYDTTLIPTRYRRLIELKHDIFNCQCCLRGRCVFFIVLCRCTKLAEVLEKLLRENREGLREKLQLMNLQEKTEFLYTLFCPPQPEENGRIGVLSNFRENLELLKVVYATKLAIKEQGRARSGMYNKLEWYREELNKITNYTNKKGTFNFEGAEETSTNKVLDGPFRILEYEQHCRFMCDHLRVRNECLDEEVEELKIFIRNLEEHGAEAIDFIDEKSSLYPRNVLSMSANDDMFIEEFNNPTIQYVEEAPKEMFEEKIVEKEQMGYPENFDPNSYMGLDDDDDDDVYSSKNRRKEEEDDSGDVFEEPKDHPPEKKMPDALRMWDDAEKPWNNPKYFEKTSTQSRKKETWESKPEKQQHHRVRENESSSNKYNSQEDNEFDRAKQRERNERNDQRKSSWRNDQSGGSQSFEKNKQSWDRTERGRRSQSSVRENRGSPWQNSKDKSWGKGNWDAGSSSWKGGDNWGSGGNWNKRQDSSRGNWNNPRGRGRGGRGRGRGRGSWGQRSGGNQQSWGNSNSWKGKGSGGNSWNNDWNKKW